MLANVTITIEGNLAADPQLQQVGDKDVCNFTVASSVGSKDENGNRLTNFFECSAWGPGGKWLFDRMQKGTGVTVNGEFEAVEVTNKETGAKRTKLRVATTNVRLRSKLREVKSDEAGAEDPTE
jgi:single-strand DNA-binding protein